MFDVKDSSSFFVVVVVSSADVTGRDVTGRDVTGRDRGEHDVTGRDVTGRDVTGRDRGESSCGTTGYGRLLAVENPHLHCPAVEQLNKGLLAASIMPALVHL